MWVSAAFTFFIGFLALCLRTLLVWENKKLDEKYGPKADLHAAEGVDLPMQKTAMGEEYSGSRPQTVRSRRVETFACGHEEKHKIPCEEVCDNKSCTEAEEDQSRVITAKCTTCKDEEDEAEFILEELQKFVERESLDPSAAVPTRIRDPSALKLYFKRCLVWSKCGHHSHPRSSDIERDMDEPEFLYVEGIGNCFDCSAAPSSTIHKMKQSGDYSKEDPWGAMSRPEIAEDIFSAASLPLLEDIGRGVVGRQTKERTQVDVQSAPCSPETSGGRAGTAASSESEYEINPSKGKVKDHPDLPIRHPSYTTNMGPNASDVEDVSRRASRKSTSILETHEEEGESEEFEDDYDKEEKNAGHQSCRSRKRSAYAASASDEEDEDGRHVSGGAEADGKVPHWGFSTRNDNDEAQDDLHGDSADSRQLQRETEDERPRKSKKRREFVSPEELMAADLHPSLEMTRALFEEILKSGKGYHGNASEKDK
ncbi:MAG: hypothetical protein LQ341_004403 [Variospora aurantia]|nr:MAG: hypothetical protein LQ341_004403 [Variospora aurantia]